MKSPLVLASVAVASAVEVGLKMVVQNKTLRFLVVLLQRLGGMADISAADLEASQHLNVAIVDHPHGQGAKLELLDQSKSVGNQPNAAYLKNSDWQR